MKLVPTFVKRLTRLVTSLLLIAITAACAAYVVPSFFGYERYVITGGSMSGTFEKGSVAFEKPVPVSELEVGDVITYLPPGDSGVSTLVTHRIVEMPLNEDGSQAFITQGDANPDPDPWRFSLLDETQPVVTTTVPWVGYVFIGLANREIRMLVIGGPAAVIALISLVELIRAVPRRTSASTAPDVRSEHPAAGRA